MGYAINNRKRPKSQTYFSIFLALYPVLCLYKAFASFTIGDVILICALLCYIFFSKTITISKKLFAVAPLMAYVVVLFLIRNLLIGDISGLTATTVFFRVFKFIFYLSAAVTISPKYISRSILEKGVVLISTLAALFIYLQYIFYYGFGQIILGRISFLPLYLEEYGQIDYDLVFGTYYFRPTSFFLEPAMASQYMVVGLAFLLFSKNIFKSRTKAVCTVIITAGILMTTAAQGIIYLVVVFALYMIQTLGFNMRSIFIVFSAFLIALAAYIFVPGAKLALDRLLFNDGASDARLGSIDLFLQSDFTDKLIGHGYGVILNNVYATSATYILYGCGIIGFVLTLYMFYKSYKKADCKESKIVCILFFTMLFGTSLFCNYMLFWFFSAIVGLSEKRQQFKITEHLR
ncbi:MAG: hypothetical protein IKC95_06385 [Oscillospiraceae bacterium]|nr:hypothetical protein [Oscillospiraceae bacterium]